MKSSLSDVPLGISQGHNPGFQSSTSRVQGIMNVMAQKTSTTDIFSNASSYFSGVWSSSSPKSSPKRK
jgi:hypothetical protein